MRKSCVMRGGYFGEEVRGLTKKAVSSQQRVSADFSGELKLCAFEKGWWNHPSAKTGQVWGTRPLPDSPTRANSRLEWATRGEEAGSVRILYGLIRDYLLDTRLESLYTLLSSGLFPLLGALVDMLNYFGMK